MTALLELRDKLQDTHATIEGMQRAMAAHPDDQGLALTVRSLERRQQTLAQAFRAEANIDHLDVCNYRIMSEESSCSIAAITHALGSFQDLLSVVFDAFKNGPKIRARLSAEIVSRSTLDFGYAYPGSLGFVLTMPNERLLVGESELDRAIAAIFEMAKAETPQQLAAHVAEVGVAGIRRLYSWSSAHAEYGLSADIKWQRKDHDRAGVIVQKEELARLREIIDQASEEKVEGFEIVGELIGLDVGSGYSFRIAVPGAEDIDGKIAENFDRSQSYVINNRYTARLLKKSKIFYSTEREEEWWELLELAPP
jgi:hypothetical protein